MPLSVSNGTAWVPAKDVSVSLGPGQWTQAKSVKRSDGAGGWTIVWLPDSSVTLTGRTQALASDSGIGAALPPSIVPTELTVTLGAPDSVATVVLEYSTDGVSWSQIASWTNPTQDTLVHGQIFFTAGTWQIRARITQVDMTEIISNVHTVTSYTKTIRATTTNASPDVFERFTIGSLASAPDPVATGRRWLLRPLGATLGVPYGSGPWSHQQEVWQERDGPYEWFYEETFVDGSILYSAPVLVTAAAISHFHEAVTSGPEIQTAMDRASRWYTIYFNTPIVDFDNEQSMACVELVTMGVAYDIGTTPLHCRRGVRLQGNGATIRGNGTHIFNGDDNGGGRYNSPNFDWLLLDVTLDARMVAGGVSTAHTRRFRMKNVTIKNIGGGKHHVEINSSGGVASLSLNCQIIGCTFYQEGRAAGVRTEDEAIQIDYSWNGAAPNVANDGTVTNNVLIAGCTFRQVPRAIGGHVYNSKPTKATGIPTNIRIEGNTFTSVNPVEWGNGANSAASEGAVRVYYWKDVIITSNTWSLCYQPLMIYAPDDSLGAIYPMGLTQIIDNVFDNCGGAAGRHCAYGNSGGGNPIGQVLFERNRLTGTWGGGATGYFFGADDTNGTVPVWSTGVVITGNRFEPSNYTPATEISYNKYRAANSTNVTGVTAQNNTVSDGSISNT